MNGVINIYKNTGMTSFDVVAIVRRVAKMKK
ncbi:MAG: tRNA pseudouridine(55) synthase TruB, partial [Clostridium perfringens]